LVGIENLNTNYGDIPMTIKAKFVRDGLQVINVATATTMTCTAKYLLLLDQNGKKLFFRDGEGLDALFSDFKKSLKPDETYGLVLDNGGFIDLRCVANVFVSPKTGNLVVMSNDERPLCVLLKEVYKDLDGLANKLMDVMVELSPKNKIEKIDWEAYKG